MKELGYFYSTSTEKPEDALELYIGSVLVRACNQTLYRSKDATEMWIEKDKNAGITHKNVKPRIYRLVIEEVIR